MQFPQHHLKLADVFLASIPERYRQMRRQEGIKREAPRLSLETMNSSDPSEGIRASEIVPLVASRLEIRHLRYIGGTLLLLIFNEIAGNFREDDAEIMPLVNALIALDNFLIDNAVLPLTMSNMVCQKTSNQLPIQTTTVVPQALLSLPRMAAKGLPHKPAGSISANPNALIVNSQGFGQTTFSWTSYAISRVEVRVNAPDGPVFTASGPGSFSKQTGHWARAGITFYLQNVSNGLPLSADNTLAKVTLTG
jgi:hypothetical protein